MLFILHRKIHETSSPRSSCSKSVNQEWFLACDVMAVFTDPCPFEGDSSIRTQSEHTQPGASIDHNCTVPLFTSVPRLFFCILFLQCMIERLLYRVADVHWSYTTPMSRTHPMCLLLATLHNRAGPTGRKRGSQKRGEGEKSKEFDMLCAWVTCIKQRQSVYACAWKE